MPKFTVVHPEAILGLFVSAATASACSQHDFHGWPFEGNARMDIAVTGKLDAEKIVQNRLGFVSTNTVERRNSFPRIGCRRGDGSIGTRESRDLNDGLPGLIVT